MNDFIHPSLILMAGVPVLWLFPGKVSRWFALVPAVFVLLAVLTMKPGLYGEIRYLGLNLTLGRVDTLSMVFAHVFAIQAVIGFIYALHVSDKYQHIAASLYAAGGFGCVFASDMLTLFIFWELMSICSTLLIWLNRNRKSTAAGFRYFLFHIFGGLLLLAGILIKWKLTGSLAFNPVDPASARFYDYLIMAGFCVNAAVIPLHAWLPDAYPEATITGAVFMSAFTTKTAVYALMRGFTGMEVLAYAGVAMTIFGVAYATIENNARRILSYHIVSQVGYMVAGIGIGTAMTINGSCAHAYAHILYKGLLFMSAGALLYSTGTAKLNELGGLASKLPWVFFWYMVAGLSISGVPLFSGFVSKTMTITGAAQAHHPWLALGMEFAAVGTFLSVGIKLPYFAFYGGKDKPAIATQPVPQNMYLAMGIAGALCILIGLYPDFLYRLLPNPVEYHPFAPWHVLQASLLIAFTGLGFYILRFRLKPENKLNLDFDYFYRLIGNCFVELAKWPVEKIDNFVGEVYNRFGLKGLLKGASFSAWFDKFVIDGVVDGTAVGTRTFGGFTTLAQTGKLQDYIGYAVCVGVCIFAVVWYFG